MSSFINILQWAEMEIKKNIYTDVPGMEAEILLAYLLGISREKLYINLYNEFPGEYIEKYKFLISERIKGKPIAYIKGTKEFMSLEFFVNSSVLIPRPETEILVEEVIRLVKEKNVRNPVICDIGTGSGNIALSLAKYIPEARIYATDISSEALMVAQKNYSHLKLKNTVTFCECDLFKSFEKKEVFFDIIVSNPPYISFDELPDLSPSVRDYEPHSALFAEDKGYYFFKEIVIQGQNFLKKDGFLAMEAGIGQTDYIKNFMKNYMEDISIIKDLSGIDRVVTGFKRSDNSKKTEN
jgi:release factor glutamine methyltransferase